MVCHIWRSEWQFTGASKARLPSTSWTAATPHRTLPASATSIFQPPPSCRTTTSSQHARPSGVLRRRSDGLECAAWRPPRPVAQCRQFPQEAKDASVSECTWTLSAVEALRNALYKFKTYLLTYCRTAPISMTLNDPTARFQGQSIVWCWISPKWLKIRP